jgi:hypothetical protein
VGMMVVMTMVMTRISKCRSRNQENHGEQQSLFHSRIIATAG